MIYTTVESGPIHYPPVGDKSSAFGIWGRVFGFSLNIGRICSRFFPLLFLPVFTDALHTLLIQQHVRQQAFENGCRARVPPFAP